MSPTFLMIFIVVAGVMSLQFYKGRKLNALLMINYIRGFEEALQPKDKDYIYLGGSVGFKARYLLQNKFAKEMQLTLTLLPRQSLLWFPVSFITRGGDRLYIVLSPKFKIQRDAHIVRKFYHRFGADIKEKDLSKEDMKIGNSNFVAYYKNKEDVMSLKKIIEETFTPERVGHIAVNRENNTLYCIIKPDPNFTSKELKKLIDNLPQAFEDWTYFKED